MSEFKPRQFWIDPCRHPDSDLDFYFGDALIKHPKQGPLQWQQALIHVIEYSAFEKLKAENERLQAKLNQNKCNSGHETLPLALWDCPECTRIRMEESKALKAENEKAKELIGKLKIAARKYNIAVPDDVHFEDCITTVDEEKECDCGVLQAENNLYDVFKEIEAWESGE